MPSDNDRKKRRTKTLRLTGTIVCSLAVLMLCMSIGSVSLSPGEMALIWRHKLLGTTLPATISPSAVSILWTIRMPRAMTAFLVGGMLSVSGFVMQSVLQNPLASSYTLGVSSGASLGAAMVMAGGLSLPLLGTLTLPVTGFAFSLGTVLFVLGVSSRFDRNVASHTVILFGMVVSLFMNAMLTMINALNAEHSQELLLWQMGSFNGRRWYHVMILAPCALAGLLLLLRSHRELDILTFGDEQSMAVGVDVRPVKRWTLTLAAFLTGVSVCFTGTIGFVDLIVPHLVRRLFGPAARYGLVMCFFFGGGFMALADLASRTLLAPSEIPVGAVTALIGAPFFLWIYFGGTGRGGRT